MLSPWYIDNMKNLTTYPSADSSTAYLKLRETVQQKEEMACLTAEFEKLNLLVALFTCQGFGSKPEHYLSANDTPSLFQDKNLPEPVKEVKRIPVAEHSLQPRQPNVLAEIPADLPREERIIAFSEQETNRRIIFQKFSCSSI